MQKVVSMVLLNAAYIVGIGPMAVLFCVMRKNLLQSDNETSTFQPISGSDDMKRMY